MPRLPEITPLSQVKKSAIVTAMDELNCDIPRVAAALKVAKTTIYRKLREYGLRVRVDYSTGKRHLTPVPKAKVRI